MGWKEIFSITGEELIRKASWRLGMMPLDEVVTLKRLNAEGIKTTKEGNWYRLILSRGKLKREVGGKIEGDPLEVLLRCYLLLWEEGPMIRKQEAA